VLTSYLVSNAIVLPLGGWASSVMGGGTSLFFASSSSRFRVFCAARRPRCRCCWSSAYSRERAAEAAAHGAGHYGRLVRTKQARPGLALYGLVAVLAPSIGPTLGGWITDNFSWRWIFFIIFR